MKRTPVNIFILFFLKIMLLSGCKNRETVNVQNTANLTNETSVTISNNNDNNNLMDVAVTGNNNGIINTDGINICEHPYLDAPVIGQLNRGNLVTVLGRTRDRMYLDGGYDSFWLKININDIEGWVYGAYVNLFSSQYEELPILSDIKHINIIDLNYSRNLPEHELIEKEREMLMLQADRFKDVDIQEYYNAIVNTFNKQQNLRPYFLNTLWVGVTETSMSFDVSSSSFSDFIQASYVDNITISPLIKKSETSASFIIDGFRQIPDDTDIRIKAIAVNIKRIENTSFSPLNGKTVIDLIVVSPYSAEDFIENSWGDIDFFYSFMTSGGVHFNRSFLLREILGEVDMSEN